MIATLPSPKSVIANILYSLITEHEISEQQYRVNGFRSRISDLRLKYGLDIRFKEKTGKNQFGRSMIYRVHYLLYVDKEAATGVYLKLNSNG